MFVRFFIMGILPLGVVSVLNFRIYSAVRFKGIPKIELNPQRAGGGGGALSPPNFKVTQPFLLG